MKAFARKLLVLAAALFGVQQAIACCCLDDLIALGDEPVAEVPSCGTCPDEGPVAERHGCPPDCSECTELESATSAGVAKAIASKNQPGLKLPPAIANHSWSLVRPQTVPAIGPPPAVPRPAQTPVLLKQRLLI